MSSQTKPLTERMQAFYENLSAHGVEALTQLDSLYAEDIAFYAPIETRLGLKAFRASWERAFTNFKAFTFTDFSMIGTDEAFALFYTMTIEMSVGEPMPTPVATVFRANAEGKVFYQFDYWDTAGGLCKIYPPLSEAYKWAVALLFGGGAPIEGHEPPLLGKDGCFHPSSESELIALVKLTQSEKVKLRVAGSGHSVWESIVPDGFTKDPLPTKKVVVLDKYQRIIGFKKNPDVPGEMLVEVEAGINLGEAPRLPVAYPISPTAFGSDSTPNITQQRSWEQSLCYQLQERGYALTDLGGITHQAVGGFMSTGSAGGTCKWSFSSAVHAIRVIDAHGNAVTLTEKEPDPDWFAAAGVAMGLCGVVSTVTLRCVPTFNIKGTETTSRASEALDVDFYNTGNDARPSLAKFLLETDYTRLMWWPQHDFDRLVVWKADHVDASPDFKPKPYEELGKWPIFKQMAASVLYTILGNLNSPDKIPGHLQLLQTHEMGGELGAAIKELAAAIRSAPAPDPTFNIKFQEEHPWLSEIAATLLGERHPAITLGSAWDTVAETIANMLDKLVIDALDSVFLKPLVKLLSTAIPHIIDNILSPFVALGPDGAPTTQDFQDFWYLGLPMDNGMDDLLMPTFFTEIWIPFTEEGGEVDKAVQALRTLFRADGTANGAYAATGPYSYELYATKGDTRFSLNPAWGLKNIFRVDIFWFGYNAGNPVTDAYPKFWKALEDLDFRLHWGKFLPNADQLAPEKLLARFPEWNRFKKVRQRVDPDGIFLTNYWKRHLGL